MMPAGVHSQVRLLHKLRESPQPAVNLSESVFIPDRAKAPAAPSARTALRVTTMRRDALIGDWDLLSDDLQFALSAMAMLRAVDTVARQAELLAGEMEMGILADRGGPDALRLLAAVMREAGRCGPGVAGTA